MPELPDLEAYSKNLKKIVIGQKIKEVIIYKPGKLNVTSEEINDALVSFRINNCYRDGKEMMFTFDNEHLLKIHLMLNGMFNITNNMNRIDFKMFALDFGDISLIVSDPAGWAKMELNPQKSKVPDALADAFTFEYFAQMITKKKTKNIKAFLIDQKIVRGIGNAYVDEILWEAKISPESKAGKIPENILIKLFDSIKVVLNRSISEILEVKSDIISGEIRNFMRVHHRDKYKCPNGYPIQCKKVVSKKTYFTEEQQIYS